MRRRPGVPSSSTSTGIIVGAPVLDYQVLLDPTAAAGYVRDWQAPGMAPERHLAYAGQWGLLAVGALAGAVWLAVKTVRRKP